MNDEALDAASDARAAEALAAAGLAMPGLGFGGSSTDATDGIPPVGAGQKSDGDKARAVMGIVSAATFVTCRVYAATQKIRVSPELARSFALTPEEESQLEPFAPYAYPYLMKLLQHMDIIGAIAFGAVWVVQVSTRFSAIKEERKAQRPTEEKKSDGSGASTNKTS